MQFNVTVTPVAYLIEIKKESSSNISLITANDILKFDHFSKPLLQKIMLHRCLGIIKLYCIEYLFIKYTSNTLRGTHIFMKFEF